MLARKILLIICTVFCPVFTTASFHNCFCAVLYCISTSEPILSQNPAGDRACLNMQGEMHRNDGRQHSSRHTHTHAHWLTCFELANTTVYFMWIWVCLWLFMHENTYLFFFFFHSDQTVSHQQASFTNSVFLHPVDWSCSPSLSSLQHYSHSGNFSQDTIGFKQPNFSLTHTHTRSFTYTYTLQRPIRETYRNWFLTLTRTLALSLIVSHVASRSNFTGLQRNLFSTGRQVHNAHISASAHPEKNESEWLFHTAEPVLHSLCCLIRAAKDQKESSPVSLQTECINESETAV